MGDTKAAKQAQDFYLWSILQGMSVTSLAKKEDYKMRKASKSDHCHGSQRLILRERENRTET